MLTDVVMANRMLRRRPIAQDSTGRREKREEKQTSQELARPDRVGPLAVLTEGLWKREALALRALEKGMLAGVEKWILKPQEAAWREALQHRFVKPEPMIEEPAKVQHGWVRRIWERLRK